MNEEVKDEYGSVVFMWGWDLLISGDEILVYGCLSGFEKTPLGFFMGPKPLKVTTSDYK